MTMMIRIFLPVTGLLFSMQDESAMNARRNSEQTVVGEGGAR